SYAQSQARRPHSVQDRQNALLELFALGAVRLLRRVLWNCTGLLSEGKIWVAGPVGRHHRWVAGECPGDAELLLAPINVGDAIARRRLDQPAQPHAGAEDRLTAARLIPPSAGAKWRDQVSIPTVSTHR